MRNTFCGWYFKCQSPEHTLALIPAVHDAQGIRSGSIQIISNTDHWNIPLAPERLQIQKDRPRAVLGKNHFCEDWIHLDLHTRSISAKGELYFGPPTSLRYDIMGPFRYVPFMECRHNVFSMRHRVDGCLTINGTPYCFENDLGYLEGDQGHSFPKHYIWTQCCFPEGSLMLSVAEIPFGPFCFTGIIGVLLLRGKEYRLATYLGAKAIKIQDGEVMVRQGDLQLTATLLEQTAYPLQAPVGGKMTRTIRENVACHAQYQFSKKGYPLWVLETHKASFEYEYP